MPFRESVERASAPLVERLTTLPRWAPFLGVLALMVAGTFLPYGWVLFVLVWLFLAWLLALAWPRLRTPERLFRIAVLAFVGAVVIVRAVER